MIWNLLQDHRFFTLRDKADTLERRVKALEARNAELQDLLHKVLYALEEHVGKDIDHDHVLGAPKGRRTVVKIRPYPSSKR